MSGGIRGCRGVRGVLGLAGSVGTKARRSIGGKRGHWGLLAGVRAIWGH